MEPPIWRSTKIWNTSRKKKIREIDFIPEFKEIFFEIQECKIISRIFFMNHNKMCMIMQQTKVNNLNTIIAVNIPTIILYVQYKYTFVNEK